MNQGKVEFHAGHKLAWLEAIASDSAMTGTTVKVAIAISQRAQRDGVARTASQPAIAKRIHITDRAVRACIRRLRRAGYLEQLTPGGRTLDGRGRAAEFRLVNPQRSSQAAKTSTTTDQRNIASGNPASEHTESAFQNSGSRLPPLPSTSHNKFLTRAQTHSSDTPAQSEPSCPWPAIKEALARQESFGIDKVEAWLRPLRVKGCTGGVLTLISSRRFLVRFVAQNFERFILDAWCKIDSGARRVTVEYGAAPLPAEEADDDDDVVHL